jgi:hypothetical protein
MTENLSVSNNSASRIDVGVEDYDNTGETEFSPVYLNSDPMYAILGHAAHAERQVRAFKESQVKLRELQARVDGEMHLLRVHAERVKNELKMSQSMALALKDRADRALKQALKDFESIQGVLDKHPKVAELYDDKPISDIRDSLKKLKFEAPDVASMERNIIIPAEVLGVVTMSPGLPSAMEAAKQACLGPVVKMETWASRQSRNS